MGNIFHVNAAHKDKEKSLYKYICPVLFYFVTYSEFFFPVNNNTPSKQSWYYLFCSTVCKQCLILSHDSYPFVVLYELHSLICLSDKINTCQIAMLSFIETLCAQRPLKVLTLSNTVLNKLFDEFVKNKEE